MTIGSVPGYGFPSIINAPRSLEMRVTFFCRAWKPHYLYSSQIQPPKQFVSRKTFSTMTSAADIPNVKVGSNASVPVVRSFHVKMVVRYANVS